LENEKAKKANEAKAEALKHQLKEIAKSTQNTTIEL
jgi:hypothetical protein